MTNPAPVRNAALPANAGAPTNSFDPPTIIILPKDPLFDPKGRIGILEPTKISVIRFTFISFISLIEIPISNTSTFPQKYAAGWVK